MPSDAQFWEHIDLNPYYKKHPLHITIQVPECINADIKQVDICITYDEVSAQYSARFSFCEGCPEHGNLRSGHVGCCDCEGAIKCDTAREVFIRTVEMVLKNIEQHKHVLH